MTPAEYGRYTVVELAELLDGYLWRQDDLWERTAWAVSHLINVSGKSVKRRVTVKHLLGRAEGAVEAAAASETDKAALIEALSKGGPPEKTGD